MWRSKNPQSAMCLGVVGSDGNKMPLHWFEKKPGKRGVDQAHYIEVMDTVVIPWIKKTYEDKGVVYCFQQDGAPCHTGALTQAFCEENLQDFWPKDLWPPSTPDGNPLVSLHHHQHCFK